MMMTTMNERDALLTPERQGGRRDLDRSPSSFFKLLRERSVPGLDNTVVVVGSTARDHLANERTFLAWIRTAISVLGVGIALLKWQGLSSAHGYLVLSLGTMLLISCTYRYLDVTQQLAQNRFVPNVTGNLAVVISILLVMVAVLVMHVMGG